MKFANAAARAQGVRPGMPLAEATALLQDRSLALHAEAHDPRADLQALETLRQACRRFSPLVGRLLTLDRSRHTGRSLFAARSTGELPPRETQAADCLLLEVTGLGPLFGGEQVLAEQVVEYFQRRGYHVRVAVANTIGAAWAVAHWGWGAADPARRGQIANGQASGGQVSGGQASGGQFAEPEGGAWVVPADMQREVLAGLPVEALRLEPRQRQLLRQLGLERVEQLMRLSRRDLSARLGADLLRRLDQALGTVEELLEVPPLPLQFAARWEGEQPLTDRSQVEEVLRELVQEVAAELAVGERAVVRLVLQLECECRLESEGQESEGRETRCLEIGMFRPTAEVRHLVELARLQLERLRLPGPVTRIHVTAPLTVPREHRQQQMFAEPERQGQVPVARLVDRLRSRLGDQAVLQARLQADAQPEKGWEARGQGSGVGGQGEAKGQGVGGQGARPLFLFCPPLPIHVIAVAPDGPPIRFALPSSNPAMFSPRRYSLSPSAGRPVFPRRFPQHWTQVAQSWGPERIETGWWRGPSVRRDYYRIATSSGSRFWIYRQCDDGQWFLHGEFG